MLNGTEIFKRILKIVINTITILLLIVLLSHIIHERILLNRYIRNLEDKIQVAKPYDSDDIILIRDFVNEDIERMPPELVQKRPQAGLTVRKILIRRQGLCGEGTRLLYHILRSGGVKSRRLYLHGNQCLHVLLEYKARDHKWYLLETINGPGEEFRNALNNNFTIDSLFNFGPYRYHVTPNQFLKNYCYQNFSYLPLNGMLNNKFFRMEVYVHRPLPSIINYFQEKHELFIFLLFLTFLILYNRKAVW